MRIKDNRKGAPPQHKSELTELTGQITIWQDEAKEITKEKDVVRIDLDGGPMHGYIELTPYQLLELRRYPGYHSNNTRYFLKTHHPGNPLVLTDSVDHVLTRLHVSDIDGFNKKLADVVFQRARNFNHLHLQRRDNAMTVFHFYIYERKNNAFRYFGWLHQDRIIDVLQRGTK